MTLTKALSVLVGTCVASAATVGYVHYIQVSDTEAMKENVKRDILLEELKKHKNSEQGGECESGLCDLKTSRIVTEDEIEKAKS